MQHNSPGVARDGGPVVLRPIRTKPCFICYNAAYKGGAVAQWIERWTCNQQVMGSNPAPGKAAA